MPREAISFSVSGGLDRGAVFSEPGAAASPVFLDVCVDLGQSHAMYRIIGTDGREYGPVSAVQLRQWICEGRVNAETKALGGSSAEWRSLGSIPECSSWFAPAGSASASAPPPVLSRPSPARKTNSFAVVGLTMGILSVTIGVCCHGIPFNVIGLVFSLIALSQIKESPQMYEGRGMAMAGLILSAASLLLAVVIVVLSGGAAFGHHFWRHVRRL
jgi:hypothetical protein